MERLPFIARCCLVLAVTLAAGCSGSEDPAACGTGVEVCQANADCGGLLCENGCCSDKRVCADDSECPSPQVCNGGACQEPSTACASSAECKLADANTPVCELVTGQCVQCTADTECFPAGTKVCNPETKTCQAKPGVCFRDLDCRGNAAGSFCRVTTHACVECLLPEHCIGGNVCSNFACRAATGSCSTSADCNGTKPVCDTTRGTCVECIDEGSCSTGEICASSVCVPAPTGCQGDDDCAQNLNGNVCDLESGDCVECRNDGQCDPQSTCVNSDCVPRATGCTQNSQCTAPGLGVCNTGNGQCVACTASTQCPANNTCTNNACVPNAPTGCQSDGDCASSGSRSKCVTAAGPNRGTCVECRTGADCASGLCSAAGTCQPGCAADANCAAPTAKCNVAAATCVACLADGDCTQGSFCRQNACEAGCASNADCASNPAGSKCRTDTKACVACLADADCGAGKRCDQNQCVLIPTGAGDPPCGANDACAAGSVCLDEGDVGICRKSCDPYNPGSACAADKVCTWVGFTTAGAPSGACLPKNNKGADGTVCQSGADCEQHLFCLPMSPTQRKCQKLCNPTGGTCATGDTCHKIPAFYDPDEEVMLSVGMCLPSASKLYASCSSDYSTNGSGGTRPDCGADMTCGPNGPILDPSIRLSVCQYPVGAGEAKTSCTDASQCRTGDCLQGPGVCNTSCRWASDCDRAALTANYKCLPYLWLAESDVTGDVNASVTGACLPTCKSSTGCSTGNFCMLSPTFENSGQFISSFYGSCYPKLGDPAGANKKSGQRCKADGECESGSCVTSGAAGATDGYCFGTCDTAALAQCDGANGVVCDPAGIGLRLNDGRDGVAGNGDDAYGRAFMCVGKRCGNDADCAGTSADVAKPRSCRLTLQVNGTNSEYNNATTVLRTSCEPRVGAAKGGARCSANAECASGRCLSFQGGASICFGACRTNTDCDGRSSTCAEVDFAGQILDACAPN